MRTIDASPDRIIQLGYEGEDKTTTLCFSYTEDWLSDGEGHFDVRVLRHGDTEAYNAVSVTDDRENMRLLMTVTDVELSIRGYGEMQVVYSGTDFVRKSPVYRYNVSRAIDGEIVDPPEGSIINQIVRDLAAIKETKADKSYVDDAISHVSIDVDSDFSDTSENPVQNKVLTTAFINASQMLQNLGYTVEDNGIQIESLKQVKADKTTATASSDGLMSAQDKARLDAVCADYSSALAALGGGS